MSDTKVYEEATCPYCGHKSFHTFHYGSDTLICHNCDKEFAIKLETTIVVKSAKLYDKICETCGVPLYNDEIVKGTCPNCNGKDFVDNKNDDSELTVSRSYWEHFAS